MLKGKSKALYNFTKRLRNKENASTKDFDDSLEQVQKYNQDKQHIEMQNVIKPTHFRSQSCPHNNEVNEIINFKKNNKKLNKEVERIDGLQVKIWNRKANGDMSKLCDERQNSQISFQNNTVIVHNTPLECFSSILYKKSSNQESSVRKKENSKIATLKKRTILGLKNEEFVRTRLEQQIKTYELTELLRIVQKQSQNTGIRHQLLEDLIKKYQNDIQSSAYQFM